MSPLSLYHYCLEDMGAEKSLHMFPGELYPFTFPLAISLLNLSDTYPPTFHRSDGNSFGVNKKSFAKIVIRRCIIIYTLLG